MTDYKQAKEIATGLYARRICGDVMDRIAPVEEYDGDFPFDFVNDCDVPKPDSGGDLRQHEAAWDLFFRDFNREWKKYVNSQVLG